MTSEGPDQLIQLQILILICLHEDSMDKSLYREETLMALITAQADLCFQQSKNPKDKFSWNLALVRLSRSNSVLQLLSVIFTDQMKRKLDIRILASQESFFRVLTFCIILWSTHAMLRIPIPVCKHTCSADSTCNDSISYSLTGSVRQDIVEQRLMKFPK